MILPKLRQAGKDALRNIWLFKARHLASLAVTALAFLTVGLFFSLANNLRLRADEASREAAVVFYLRPGLSAAESVLVAERIEAGALVARADLIDAESARKRFLSQFPDLEAVVQSLGRNPFPASIETTLRDPDAPTEAVQAFMAEIRGHPGVEDAVFNREGAERIRSIGRLAEAVGLGFGGLLILAAVVVISGVISLNIIARRDEIEILRLVGATKACVRGPYLLEGLLIGVLGSAIALVLTAAASRLFPAFAGGALGPIGELFGFRALSLPQALGLVAAGGGAGLLGSAFSLARLLKI